MAAGISEQHGKVTAQDVEFESGEPVFIVRATDMGSVAGLIAYARVMQEKDRSAEADSAFDAAMHMSEWQRDNPEKVHYANEKRGGKRASKKAD
jgi:hypothetical protein